MTSLWAIFAPLLCLQYIVSARSIDFMVQSEVEFGLEQSSEEFYEPTICDPSVQQYSGYLDISGDKHLFYWLVEAQQSPADAPLILWLNGGPGGSSMIGLMSEIGPCTIEANGTYKTKNPFSWNRDANLLFLDQPIHTGWSYADPSVPLLSTAADAAEDAYTALQLFFSRHAEYTSAPFYIVGESFGGAYVPHLASIIHQRKIENQFKLEAIGLVAPLTNPLVQMPTISEYVCKGPYAMFEPGSPTCEVLRVKASHCELLIAESYVAGTEDKRRVANEYCWTIWGDLEVTGRNMCDVRKEGGMGCHVEISSWMDAFMNKPSTRKDIGAYSGKDFRTSNITVQDEFMNAGELMRDSMPLLPPLLRDGLRVLVMAGDADMMCNFIGVERWVAGMPSVFHDEFEASSPKTWFVGNPQQEAGVVRSAGQNNLTFVTLYGAGHMAPMDQPEAAFELIDKWLVQNVPVA